MTDEVAAAEETGADEEIVANEEAEAPEAEAETLAQDDESEGESEDDGEAEEAEPETVEFDYGGNKFKVPKGALPEEMEAQLDGFLKNSWRSHTEKSMAVAEQAKRVEARESAVEKLAGLQGDMLDKYSHGLAIQRELAQFQDVDLNALWQTDPDQARRVSDYVSQKRAEFQSVINEVAEGEQNFTRAQQAEVARRAEEGKQIVTRQIKDFEAKAAEVIDYAMKNYGVSETDAKNWALNPTSAIMAYKAMMFDKSQAAVAKAAKPKPAEAKPMKPMKGKGAPEQRVNNAMSARDMAKYLGLPG
jgi:hypothetical protein